MKARKILVSIAAVALVAAISIGGTLAWLTDKTENVVNTFTVGNVNIKLDETDIKNPTGDRTQDGNKYEELMPGYTYTKDPMVTILPNSEACYVRMKVTVKNIDKLKAAFPGSDYYSNGIFLLEKFVNNTWDSTKWIPYGYEQSTDGKDGTYEFRYYQKVDATGTEEKALEKLFTEFKLPGEMTGTQLDNLKTVEIHVTAEAIQADNFNNADAAWTEWK